MEELTWRERGRLWLRLGLRVALVALGVVLVWKVLFPLMDLLMPFVVALVLAWLLNPPIRFLQRKLNVKRGVLSLLLVLLALAVAGGVIAGIVYSLVSQVLSFLQNWQGAWADAMSGVSALTTALEELLKPLPEETYAQLSGLIERFVAWLGSVVPQMLTGAAGNAGSFAMSLPATVVGVFVFVVAAYFISADYPHLRFKASQRVPEEFRGFLSQVKRVAVDAFGGYVKAQLILSGVVALILLAGFFLMGQPYALLLAVVLAVMDFIPIIGSGTVMVPWAVIDLVLGNFGHAIGLMVTWGLIAVFRQVAEPKVVGDQTGLTPIVSLMSIYVGMRLGGVIGMVLGPVICLVALNIVRGGLLDSTAADLRLAMLDVAAILRGSRERKE